MHAITDTDEGGGKGGGAQAQEREGGRENTSVVDYSEPVPMKEGGREGGRERKRQSLLAVYSGKTE